MGYLNYLANIRRNKAMWKKWLEFGVKPDTLLEVDFFFFTHSQSAKEALAAELKNSPTRVQTSEQRKWLRKIYQIQITLPKDTWTLKKLNAMTKYFFSLGMKVSSKLILDGCGAQMPRKSHPANKL